MLGSSSFAAALALGHPPPVQKIVKKRDSKRKEFVLADLGNPNGETQKQVAKKRGISERTVRRMKHKARTPHGPHLAWFHSLMDDAVSSIDPHDKALDPPTTYTTNLNVEAEIISAKDLDNHRIRGAEVKNEKEHVRARIVNETSKDDFHGFFILDTLAGAGNITLEKGKRDRLDEIINKELPEMLANVKHYDECFLRIFETVQNVPLKDGKKKRSKEEEEDKRMGDGKRTQAKLSVLMDVAASRLRKAEEDAEKGKSGKGARRAANDLRAAKKEDALLTDLYNLLCANYECIRKVWPERVREGEDDPVNYAIIRSEADAHGQGIHADSKAGGFTILTAMEREQYVVVVLNGFRAMRIYAELVVDRAAATRVFRERYEALPGHRKIASTAWAKVEPRVWHALVHKEFAVRKLPPFKAVRVPICKGASIVLDTRCLHGGGPGDGSRGFRAHAYGTVGGPPASCVKALEKDYLTTVDILDEDNYPVGTWGQISGLWGCAPA